MNSIHHLAQPPLICYNTTITPSESEEASDLRLLFRVSLAPMTKTSQYLRNVGAMFRLLGRSQRLGILLRVLSLFCGVAIPFVIIKYQRALVENIEAGTGEKILISVAAVVSVMLVQKIVDALLSLLEGMLNDSLAVKLERAKF